MKVYVFGNQDQSIDNKALQVVEEIKDKIDNVEFRIINPNEDLPFINEKRVAILDTVQGIKKITLIENVDKFILSPRSTVHDFDLGFQLKYLKKLGKLGNVTIIGIPQNGKINYERIQSILRKLVAQDIQGS